MWSRKAPQQGCAHRRVLDDFSQLDHYATLRGKCAVAYYWEGCPPGELIEAKRCRPSFRK
jgi:hypothetical protein